MNANFETNSHSNNSDFHNLTEYLKSQTVDETEIVKQELLKEGSNTDFEYFLGHIKDSELYYIVKKLYEKHSNNKLNIDQFNDSKSTNKLISDNGSVLCLTSNNADTMSINFVIPPKVMTVYNELIEEAANNEDSREARIDQASKMIFDDNTEISKIKQNIYCKYSKQYTPSIAKKLSEDKNEIVKEVHMLASTPKMIASATKVVALNWIDNVKVRNCNKEFDDIQNNNAFLLKDQLGAYRDVRDKYRYSQNRNVDISSKEVN